MPQCCNLFLILPSCINKNCSCSSNQQTVQILLVLKDYICFSIFVIAIYLHIERDISVYLIEHMLLIVSFPYYLSDVFPNLK